MAEQATAFEEKAAAARAVKKTAKAQANVPVTKKEWTDAADRGDL